MKKFEFLLDNNQKNIFFSAIRSKVDIITLWMNTIKLALSYIPPEKNESAAKLSIIYTKMSRIILASEDKIFTANFPFFVRNIEDGFIFSAAGIENIDSRVTSEILSLLHTEEILQQQDVLDFADPICTSCDIDKGIWTLLNNLLTCEDGYLRYDYDPARVDKEVGENKHPLHHVDFFYTNSNKFKLGLDSAATPEGFQDMLDITKACSFIRSA